MKNDVANEKNYKLFWLVVYLYLDKQRDWQSNTDEGKEFMDQVKKELTIR